jgi:transcriptional regulator with XRE-family HTH domain
MDMTQRIQSRLEALGLSPRAASMKAGLNTHFLQAVLSGKSESPRGVNLEKIAAALETTPAWLMSGTGDPSIPTDAQTAEVISIMPSLDEARRAELARLARMLARDMKESGK